MAINFFILPFIAVKTEYNTVGIYTAVHLYALKIEGYTVVWDRTAAIILLVVVPP